MFIRKINRMRDQAGFFSKIGMGFFDSGFFGVPIDTDPPTPPTPPTNKLRFLFNRQSFNRKG